MERKNIIETEELTKVYDAQTAVDHLSFSVVEGEIFGFLGPNGAGKTTTLLMLLGLSEPTSGKAWVMGINPIREPIKVKRIVGYLQENMGFYRDMDARQMLGFIAELNGIMGDEAEKRIDTVLSDVGLLEEAEKKIDAYSRGMRQRLGIAEILLKEPKVAFLDEPTIGLDPDATNRMITLIKSLAREKKMTILLSSHLLYQAQKICDRFGIMINGKMVGLGTMDELTGEKFGIGKKEYTLEEVYMKFFKEE
ncbi:MAG: ABC transporter ATP-binding protein [Spirochaetota bacterium]|nr:MAG: ABC transporter ATP-binding protein [Spirochaetota bacterium]